MRLAFICIFVVLAVLGFAEFKRWQSPEFADTITPRQKARRVAIFAALTVVDALIIGGTYLPQGHLPKKVAARELLYWAGDMLLFLIALIALFVEVAATRRRVALRAAAGERDAAYKQMVETAARVEQRIVERRERPKRNGHA